MEKILKLIVALILLLGSTQVNAQYTLTDDDVVVTNGILVSCINLDIKDIIISDTLDGQLVTEIGDRAFYNQALTSITMPDNITIIGNSAFSGNALTSVILPNSVTSIGDWSFMDNNLTSITITNSVTSIGEGAFAHNSLTSINIPNSVTSIENSTFYDNALSSATIPNSVTSIGEDAFTLNSLTSITIPNSVTSIGRWAFAQNSLTSITIPNSITSIPKGAFMENNLTSITIPNSVTSIGDWPFMDNNLTSITIPNSVTSIGYAAYNNNSISIINGKETNGIFYSVSELGVDSTTIIGYGGVSDTIDFIPNSVNSIHHYAFSYNNLKSVTIPSSITFIGYYAFHYYNDLTSILLPIAVKPYHTFLNWSNLAPGSFEITDFVKSHTANFSPPYTLTDNDVVVTDGILKSCSYNFEIKDIIISDTLDGQTVTSIGEKAFYDKSLTSIKLPNSTFFIGDSAFAKNNLSGLTLPISFKEGYTFLNWNGSLPGNSVVSIFSIEYTAYFTINSNTVIFKNWDNTIISQQSIESGNSATAPADPTRTGYSFIGWDIDFSSITADTTVTAQYEINSYTVTFVDWDGSQLNQQNIDYSSSATAPANPTRTGYTFTGWDVDFTNVTEDIIVTAQYELVSSVAKIDAGKLSVFPNPVKDVLYIEVDEDSKISLIEIYNVLGEVVYTTENINQTVEIDLSNYKPGNLFLRAIDKKGNSFTTRIIKQ